MLFAVDPFALVLEEGISVGVGTCASAQFGHRVDIAFVSVFLHLEFVSGVVRFNG